MYLVQILLPLRDENGRSFPDDQFERLAQELTERFGGITAYSRSPAEGRWKDRENIQHDEIIVLEIMVQSVDRGYWADFRIRLEEEFRQDEIVIRAQAFERL